MDHDFDQDIYDNERRFEYREYKNEECRGLMDYIDDGVGWSKCSARDFSRYLTSGGTKDPCLKGNSVFSFKKCFQTKKFDCIFS